MSRDAPRKALLVVVLTAVVCSTLVSAAVVALRPIQEANRMLERSRNIMALTGLLEEGQLASDEEMLELYRGLDLRLADIDAIAFSDEADPAAFNPRRAVNSDEYGVDIPAEYDLARLGRRSRLEPVYMVWEGDELQRLIVPIRGSGMWSMLYGYVALEADMNTIADATFYEQNETPGLGDQITRPDWLAQWRGRKLFDDAGDFRFAIASGPVTEGSAAARHQVDALTGATVTADAVTALMQYWFGEHGYRDGLKALRENPPQRQSAPSAGGEG